MIVGILAVQVSIYEALTLKDKRSVIKSLKDRIGNKYNVSIAEVGDNDRIKSSLLGIALICNDSRFAQSTLSSVVDFIRKIPQLTLVDYTIEMV